MNRSFFSILLIALLLISLPSAFAVKDLMSLHGKASNAGVAINDGNLQVLIYPTASGGSALFNSGTDFDGTIKQGIFDILLGSKTTLDLNYGQIYYMSILVNGSALSFDGNARQMFQSSHGSLPLISGPAGPQGPAGQDGNNGTNGVDGNTGPQGPQGIQGIDGNTGPQGIQGIQGIQGPAGQDGNNGTNGVDGNTGPQGPQGIQGIDGNTGPQGPQGIQGIDGNTGPQGIQGIQGPAGQDGNNGTNGVDGTNGQDFNWQISWASLDSNFAQYYYKISDFNYLTFLTSLTGRNVSELTNDSNFQTNVTGSTIWQAKGSYLTSADLTPFITILQADANYQPKGNYLSPNSAIVYDGNNVSRLVNDVNYQTNTTGSTIWQVKGTYLTTIAGLNVSSLTNDSNFQTNTTGSTIWQAKGTYLSNLTGVNLSTGTNDSNWQTIAGGNTIWQAKGSYLTTIAGLNISTLNNDSAYMTKAQSDGNYWAKTSNLITVAQADANYLAKTGGAMSGSITGTTDYNGTNLNVTTARVTNIIAVTDLNGTNLNATTQRGTSEILTGDNNSARVFATGNIKTDQNILIGTNGYITISGTTMIIGMN